MAQIRPTTHPAARARRPWEPPGIIDLPRLTQLTLATGIPGQGEPPPQSGVIP